MPINSVQHLIEQFLLKNKEVLSYRQEYRTYSVTGKALHELVNKVRFLLNKDKIKKSDRVILLAGSSINWVAVYFACILSNVTVVPLDVMTDKTLLKKIQKEIKAKAIFQDRNLKLLNIKTHYLDDIDKADTINLPVVRANQNDVLEIMYTSGTTGVPKGVVLTHSNMTSGINSAVKIVPKFIRLNILTLVPLSHIFGQVYGLFSLIYLGHKIFFMDNWQPSNIIAFIKNKRINTVVLVPGLLSLLKQALRGRSVVRNLGIQLRLIGVGGAPLDISLERWWKRRGIIVLQGYGLTETTSVVSSNTLWHTKTGSVGKIAENVEVKLGKDNEIMVKGPNVTSGYYHDKQKTQDSFEDSWLKTGDIGIIKKDFLFMKERKKDLIVTSSGLNVYPTDIEHVLDKLPEISESCVLEKDNKIHAVLLLKEKTNVDILIQKANKQLLSHQRIQSYGEWPYDSFPKTPTGKIKKFVVLQKLKAGKKYIYENSLFRIIDNVLRPQQKIRQGSKLVALGMDSLKRLELIIEIERRYGIAVDETKLDNHATVSSLEKMIKEKAIPSVRFKKWQINPLIRMLRYALRQIIGYPVLSIFTRTKYEGLENLKGIKGPVIFAANHQSNLDTLTLAKKLKYKTAVAADALNIFGIGKPYPAVLVKKILSFFTRLGDNTYPFGPNIGTKASLEFTGEMLDRGYSIIFFPEAHRTRDGKIKQFMSGIGYLALHMHVPIIPMKIEGLFELLPAGNFWPRFGKSKVEIGKALFIKDMSYENAAKLIEQKVKEL